MHNAYDGCYVIVTVRSAHDEPNWSVWLIAIPVRELAGGGHHGFGLQIATLQTFLALVATAICSCQVRVLRASQVVQPPEGASQLLPDADGQVADVDLHEAGKAKTLGNDFLEDSLVQAILDGVSVPVCKKRFGIIMGGSVSVYNDFEIWHYHYFYF